MGAMGTLGALGGVAVLRGLCGVEAEGSVGDVSIRIVMRGRDR